MKRLIPALLALVMLMGSASAERPVVTALASEINPDNLVSVAFDAKINACADGVFNISGGEYPAVIMLENADSRWQVTAMEEAGDGEDYVEDIKRFADGDQELADQYFAGADLGAEANQAIRTQFIKAYVEANGLNITAYQDYGWEPVELN